MDKNKRIAVFIDCQNISHKKFNFILNELEKFKLGLKFFAYKNSNHKCGWDKIIDKYGIEPRFIIQGNKKNSLDIKMSIDMADLVLTNNFELISIVSSDRDFIHILQYISSKNIKTICFGEKKSSLSLKNNCSYFIEVPVLKQWRSINIKASDFINLLALFKSAFKNLKEKNRYVSLKEFEKYINLQNNNTYKKYNSYSIIDILNEFNNTFEVFEIEARKEQCIKLSY